MSGTNGQQRVTKTFPVFDCDAHVNDPDEIWSRYVEPEYRELVRRSYWKDEHQAVLNGRTPVIGGAAYGFPGYNPICLAGPQMTKKIARKLQQIGLTSEQKKYVEHPGAYDPRARLKEMDLMGIDQVMIIPTMMVANFPFVENVDGAYAFARAYNDWARDYCTAAPDRLFPAGWLPLQDLQCTSEELQRIAEVGGRVARAGAALWDARPLSEAPHGDLRVELELAAPAPRALGPALQALRQRAAAQDRPPAERGLLRAVLHRLRVGRDADLPAVGPLRERRCVVLRRLSSRRRRLVERDPRDARRAGARGRAGEAPPP